MKDGIIIQARTGSTRLHNKILLPFYGGRDAGKDCPNRHG